LSSSRFHRRRNHRERALFRLPRTREQAIDGFRETAHRIAVMQVLASRPQKTLRGFRLDMPANQQKIRNCFGIVNAALMLATASGSGIRGIIHRAPAGRARRVGGSAVVALTFGT
jgi:hypothetical protein